MELIRSNKLSASHPGVVFKKRILDAHGVSLIDAALSMSVSRDHLSKFVNCHYNVTRGFSKKLEESTGVSSRFWLNMQNAYDEYCKRD